MDFALSEEQRLLVETARRFVRTELMPLEGELERRARSIPPTARHLREVEGARLYAVNIPAEYGGGGLSAVDTCLAEEQFGTRPTSRSAAPSAMSTRCCCSRTRISASAGSSLGARRARVRCASPSRRRPDAAGIKSRAVRDGDGWLLSGQKIFISDGLFSDFFVVRRHRSGGRREGISLFIVDKGMRDSPSGATSR